MWAPQDPRLDSVICESGFAGDDTATTLTVGFLVLVVLFALWLRYERDPDWHRRRNNTAARRAVRRLRAL